MNQQLDSGIASADKLNAPKALKWGTCQNLLKFITIVFILHGKCNYSSFTNNYMR